MRTLLKLLLPASLIFSSCSPNVYKDKAFFSQSDISGQTLAILPVEVLYSGNLPKNWSEEHIAKLEKQQSFQLQEEIYEDFLFHASDKQKKRKWSVALIDLRIINEKLTRNNISLQDSWKMPSDELAKLLGVDMLIRARVHNVRYMSQAAAAGINVGASIIEDMLSKSGNSAVYGPRARAGERDVDLSLYHSSRSGAVARINDKNKLRVKGLPVYVRN